MTLTLECSDLSWYLHKSMSAACVWWGGMLWEAEFGAVALWVACQLLATCPQCPSALPSMSVIYSARCAAWLLTQMLQKVSLTASFSQSWFRQLSFGILPQVTELFKESPTEEGRTRLLCKWVSFSHGAMG